MCRLLHALFIKLCALEEIIIIVIVVVVIVVVVKISITVTGRMLNFVSVM